MKRVKGVEDLNICIIGTQGIVGVGAIIRMFIALCQAVAWHPMDAGSLADPASSFRCGCSRGCIAACSSIASRQPSTLVT